MSQDLMRYISEVSLDNWRRLYAGCEVYAGSAQFGSRNAKTGDTLWTVTIPTSAFNDGACDQLMVCGRLEIGRLTADRETVQEAIRLATGRPADLADIWPGHFNPEVDYAVASLDQVQPYAWVPIGHIMGDIQFIRKNGKTTNLTLGNCATIAQGLQSLRRLTPKSAARIRDEWNTHVR